MIKPGEIQTIASELVVRDTQIEKDYVISWVLYGISNNEFLRESLVFKGGTVLKKVYFPDYRFSEDLDFTFIAKDFMPDTIKPEFEKLMTEVYEESKIKLSIKDDTQHETGNYNFYIAYNGPLGGAGGRSSYKPNDRCS